MSPVFVVVISEESLFETVDGEDHLVIEAILIPPFLSLLRHLYDHRPGIGLGPDH